MPDFVKNNFGFEELPTNNEDSDEEIPQFRFSIKKDLKNLYRKNQEQKYLKEGENFQPFNQNNFKAKIIQIEFSEEDKEFLQDNEKINYLTNNDKLIQEQKDAEFSKQFLEEMPFNELESFEPFSIKCQLCLSKNEDYHNLGCKDNFCISCIYLLLENYITTSYVFPEEILCPLCLSTIPDELIRKLSSESLYDKMLEIREKLRIQKLVSYNKAFYCPVPICEGYGHLLLDEKITACIKCKFSVCTSCKRAVHPCITCEEAACASEDSEFEEFLRSANWKKCPNCGAFVEKVDGCHFVLCHSALCKGAYALCYLCGRSLTEKQHHSHFSLNGPFGNTCNTLDGIDESNSIPCPARPLNLNDHRPFMY